MRKKERFSLGWRSAAGLCATLSFIGTALQAAPPGPTPQVPEGGGAPGPFPNTSVSGANVSARGSTTFNSSVEVTGLEGQGPIPWSINRYNRGDIAVRLSPRDAVAALTNLNLGFIEFGDAAPGIAAHQAWRPQPQFGVTLPTARRNGPIDWGDGEGPFFPTMAISEASSGPGYSMVDGSFGNGDLDINLGRAGTHESSPEANFPFSVAWFPYDQGWIGGEMSGPNATTGASSWTRPTGHAAGITAGFVKWTENPVGSGTYGGLADFRLPGIDSRTNGMVFATSADGGSDVNVVGLAPKEDGNGWVLTIREDAATDIETLAGADQSEFQFVYVPFTASNLIGGYINGQDGAKLTSAGTFTLARTAAGSYDLTIPGKNGTNGTLLLQVADFETGASVPMASKAFLSYQFQDGKFVIQARKTATDTTADLADVDFYFAWVDFQTPLAAPAGPRLRSMPVVTVTDETVPHKEANLAINTDIPQVLVTTIDDANTGGFMDPITGQVATSALVGRFFDPGALTNVGVPFIILGNPSGIFTRHDVKYNPVSKQYVVVANARTYGTTDGNVPLVALVNTNGTVARAFSYDEDAAANYDDVAVAVSSRNGNFLLAAEYSFAGEGEGTVGVLFDRTGTALTPELSRLDLLQGTGDEDDPDVVYLESIDAFLYIANTDLAGGLLQNRLVGSIIMTVPGANGSLQTQTERVLADGTPAGAEGHPAAFVNPFNGELLTAFDVGGNNVANGQISFHTIGAGPAYTFTVARPEINYLTGTAGSPFRHNHPQLAADTNSSVIVIGHNARQSDLDYPQGYVVSLYDENGAALPSQLSTPYFIADSPGDIDSGPNIHNVKYSPFTDSFLVAYRSNPGVVYLTGFQVTSGETPTGGAPALAIQRTGNTLEISWPAPATGYVLESTTSLSQPNWTVVAGTPTQDGTRLELSVPADGAARFFRLRK